MKYQCNVALDCLLGFPVISQSVNRLGCEYIYDEADSEADSLALEEDEEPPVKDSRIVVCAPLAF